MESKLQATSWSEGYVADVAYSVGYYREMAPDHLAFAALGIGKSPGLAVKPKRVLELGFGMGVGFVIGAASSPDTFFEGCDFNPEHIVHARGLSDAAGLTNTLIREASFQELAAEAKEGQHDVDVIQLHGILTWVSADAHRAIVEIARKRLKPGGLLYVSYNCMPGWAAMVPVQRLMREHAKRHHGSSLTRTNGATQELRSLISNKARFFANNPSLESRIEKLSVMKSSYLAHEYLNENWFIFHFADVAEMFGQAKLSFLASANLAENIDGVSAPPEMHDQLAKATDPIWKETLRDIACNKQFRRDIYTRGVTDLNSLENIAILHSLSFTLSVPRSAATGKLPTPLGEVEGKPELYGPLADLLDGRIVSFGEIATTPVLQPFGVSGALQALTFMVHAGHVVPFVGEANSDLAAAQRLNKVLIANAEKGRPYGFLVAPIVRSAVTTTSIDLFSLSGILAGHEENSALLQHVLDTMQRLGSQPLKDGKPVTDPDAMVTVVTEEVTKFLAEKLPLFRRLGCL